MKNIRVGDLVQWNSIWGPEPLAIVVDRKSDSNSYHERIRVQWIGTPLPVQASATSVSGNRLSTWLKTDKFTIVSKNNQEGNTQVCQENQLES